MSSQKCDRTCTRRTCTASHSRRRRLAATALFVIMGTLLSPQSFAQLAKGTGKFLGGATSNPVWSKFNAYWNQITPGNAGKWAWVEGVRGTMNTTDFDVIYNHATSSGIPFKDHTFVWGAQEPLWVASLDSASQRLEVEEWFRFMGEKYSSMTFVDVVNEPFHQPPSYKQALGGDGATGWDWVITAFQLARQYCMKGVKLHLNEYNVLGNNAAATNYINLITLLKDRGLIDGIGIQGHYFEFRSHTDATSNIYVYDTLTIKSNLDRIAALGLPIYISEFDVDESNDANQLSQYKVYFPMLWTHPGVKGITFWGYIQNDIWTAHPNTYLLYSDGRERPVLPWLRKFVTIPSPPVLVSPVGTSGEPRNPRLIWRSSNSARSYRIQLSASGGMSTFVVDTTIVDTVFQSIPLAANARYYWHVRASNDSGTSAYTTTAVFMTGDQILAVEKTEEMPREFALHQNYPNPFNPATRINFSLPSQSPNSAEGRVGVGYMTTLKVYDLLGREVAVLVNEVKPAGKYEFQFDASGLASGVYVYRLSAGKYAMTRTMAVLK
jgi:endo-1,4-beta-xylanase